MNIVVCLKQVPKKDSILRIAPNKKWIDERDISYEMSEAGKDLEPVIRALGKWAERWVTIKTHHAG